MRRSVTADIRHAGIPFHQGDGLGHDRHGRTDRRARPDVRRADLLLRQRDRGHRDRQRAGKPVELRLRRRSLPLDDRAGHVRMRDRRSDVRAVHEPGHLQRPRGRQSFVLGVGNCRLGGGSDTGRPHAGRSTRPHRRFRRRWSPRRSAPAPSASPGAPRATPGGVAGYDITRDGVVIGSAGATQTSYSDATASPATTYSYAVRARDAAGNTSNYSAPAGATTPAWRRALPERIRGRVHGLDVVGRPGARGIHPAQRPVRGRREHDERRHLREEDGHRRCWTGTRASMST